MGRIGPMGLIGPMRPSPAQFRQDICERAAKQRAAHFAAPRHPVCSAFDPRPRRAAGWWTTRETGMAELLTLESLVALVTLTGLEIVLGIDNIIFIAIVVGRLPPEQRDRARTLGLTLAIVSRLLLLLTLGLMVHYFTEPILYVW